MSPLLGLAAPPQDYPWQDHARSLVAHVVVGAVAEGILRALDGPPGEPKRLWRPENGIRSCAGPSFGANIPG
jgi:hypothetical protein